MDIQHKRGIDCTNISQMVRVYALARKLEQMLRDDDIEDLLARIENGEIFEDEEDMDDLNETDYHSDLQDIINELKDNDMLKTMKILP
ncbi:hypothetical protein TNCV_3720381 [Trichonephila clavipes]|nr:hypothetical protein TNCV_3720381 [Trichonephila clavipes]